MERITSTQNPRIKDIVALTEKSKCRKDRKIAIVEGKREIANCISGGYTFDTVYFCPSITSLDEVNALVGHQQPEIVEVSENVYSKIAYREGTEGVIALVNIKMQSLADKAFPKNPFVIVLEAVEKPGNLGAVLRTADASGAAAVIVCDPLTDLFNPNLIRASLGSVFTVPVFVCSSEEACQWLKARDFQILTAQLQDSEPYYDVDMNRPTAIVFGTESNGLTRYWRDRSDARIIIPMLGKLDSLNVSVSVAILSYEAVRQKTQAQRR